MGNDINIVLRGKDETGKAFDGATQRLSRFDRSAGSAAGGANKLQSQLAGANTAAMGMDAALNGNVKSLGSVGVALGRINPQLAMFGAVMGGLGAGWQLGKRLDEALDISTRIAAVLNGVDPTQIRTFDQTVEKAAKDLEAAARRAAAERQALGQAALADIKAGEQGGPGEALRTARERARQEREQIKADTDEAARRIKAAQDRLQAEAQKMVPDVGKQRTLQDELATAQLDRDSVTRVGETRLRTIEAELKAAVNTAKEQSEKLATDITMKSITAAMDEFRRAAEAAATEIADINTAIKGLRDVRLRPLAFEALDGGRNPQEALAIKADELGRIDALGAFARAERDPAERERVRQIEKQRAAVENELRRAKDRQDAGRKLMPREEKLLAVNKALAEEEKQKRAEREAKENLKKQQDEQAKLTREQTLKELQKMRTLLEKNLQASGGL
jgi:hypothetical protein